MTLYKKKSWKTIANYTIFVNDIKHCQLTQLNNPEYYSIFGIIDFCANIKNMNLE